MKWEMRVRSWVQSLVPPLGCIWKPSPPMKREMKGGLLGKWEMRYWVQSPVPPLGCIWWPS